MFRERPITHNPPVPPPTEDNTAALAGPLQALVGAHHDEQKASRLSRVTLALALGTTVCVAFLGAVAEPNLRAYSLTSGVLFFSAYLGLGLMHERGRRGLARLLIILTGNLHVASFMAVLEWERGVYLHLFFVMVVPFGMLSRAQRRWILPLALLAASQLAGWYIWYRLIPGTTPLGPSLLLPPTLHAHVYLVNLALSLAAILFSVHHLRSEHFRAEERLDVERRRSESLLLNVLPPSIAARLKESRGAIADHHPHTTILFADLVDFTPLSQQVPAAALVAMLDEIFTRFDALAERHGLEKIKTIGDCYMAVAGAPQADPDHALAAADMALEMLEQVEGLGAHFGVPLTLRVGLHSGPVVAGVIGRRKFIYDLWGDAVNTASRMESHGVPGKVTVSAQTWALIQAQFDGAPREPLHVKGKGVMQTFLLDRRKQRFPAVAAG